MTRLASAPRFGTILLAASLAAALPHAFAAAPNPILPQPQPLAANLPSHGSLKWSLAGVELVANGGFESGTLEGWTAQGPGFGGWVADNGTLNPNGPEGPIAPLSGDFCANVNAFNFGNPTFVLAQAVAIPLQASTVTLRWQDLINNYANDGAFTDTHGVRVGIQSSTQQQLLFSTESGDPPFNPWTKRQFDISDFRGQTATIIFVLQLSQGNCNLHLDNVSIMAEAPSLVTSDVYLGASAALGPADLRGTTAGLSWTLPELTPGATYFWRIVTRYQGSLNSGPVWQFTTGPLGALDHFSWAPLASPQPAGTPFAVTLTAKDALNNTLTDFNGTANLSAASLAPGAPRHLLPNDSFTALVTFDRSTVGYSFSPSADIWVTGVRSFAGTKLSLWTDAGVPLATQSVPQNPGVWIETPLPQPVPLLAGRTYRLGAYGEGLVTHYARFDALPAFAHGSILQSYQSPGDGFPTDPHPAQWWFVDLVYQVKNAQALTVAPAVTANFVNGLWSGALSVGPEAAQVALRAQTGLATASLSSLFDLAALADADADGMPDDWETANGLNANNPDDAMEDDDFDGITNLDEYRSGTDPQDGASLLRIVTVSSEADGIHVTFNAAPNKSYSVLAAEAPESVDWTSVGHVDPAPSARAVTVVAPVSGSFTRFYKIVTPRR